MLDTHHGWNRSFKPLILGFLLSIPLILVTYFLATEHYLSGYSLLVAIIGLAGIQALVQLIFFLHLGMESKPHWNLVTFLFLILVVVVVIGGSLWIMYSLNYTMMPSMMHSSS